MEKSNFSRQYLSVENNTNYVYYLFNRSFGSLPEILYHLTYITQSRYTGALLNQIEFHNKTSLVELKWINETGFEFECDPAKRSESFGTGFGCRYV